MAATVSLLGTATFNTTSGTKTVTAAPAVGDLIVIVTANSGSTTTTAAPTDNNAGGGGTYTLVRTAVKATSADTMQVWVRNNLITSGTSTTFTQAPGTTTGGGLVVLDIQGMDKAGTSAIVQSNFQSNQASGGTPAPVLGATPKTYNAIIGAVFNASNPAALTPRTNYTEAADLGYNTPATGLEVMYRNSGETSATITWGSTSGSAFASIALELNTNLTHATTGTLTGQIGSVVGSAAHVAIHSTTGTLTGQIGSIVGSATRYRVFTTTGALTGQLGTISGTARHNIPHTTDGVLTGQLGSISGSATRYRAFATSGTLTGQGSSITGDADRESKSVPHTTTGSLTGQGSVVTGDADRESQNVPHTVEGSLVGQGSVINGNADNPNNVENIGGGTKTKQSRKPQVVVIEVDGKEYRVPVAQLNAFLEAIKTEVKEEVKQTNKKSKKKQKIVELISEPYVKIEIKSVPNKLIPEVYKKVENINTEIHSIFYVAMQKYIRDMEEEEEEILILSM